MVDQRFAHIALYNFCQQRFGAASLALPLGGDERGAPQRIAAAAGIEHVAAAAQIKHGRVALARGHIGAGAGDHADAVLATQHGGHNIVYHAVKLAGGAARCARYRAGNLGIVVRGGYRAVYPADFSILGQPLLQHLDSPADARGRFHRPQVKGVRAAPEITRKDVSFLIEEHAVCLSAAGVDGDIVLHVRLLSCRSSEWESAKRFVRIWIICFCRNIICHILHECNRF